MNTQLQRNYMMTHDNNNLFIKSNRINCWNLLLEHACKL